MKWWQADSIIDEMWIAFCIAAIAVTAILSSKINAVTATVAGSAVSALGVYLGVKPRKKILNGEENNESPTTQSS